MDTKNKARRKMGDDMYASIYTSPQDFKQAALDVLPTGGFFKKMFGGELEYQKYGEVTMQFDEQSLQKIEEVYSRCYAQLESLVKTARVIKTAPYLRIVK